MNAKMIELVCRLQKTAQQAPGIERIATYLPQVADALKWEGAAGKPLLIHAQTAATRLLSTTPGAGDPVRRSLMGVLKGHPRIMKSIGIGAGATTLVSLGAMLRSGKISKPEYDKAVALATKKALAQGAAEPGALDPADGWDTALNYAVPVAGAAGGGALGNIIGGQMGARAAGTAIGGLSGGALAYWAAKWFEGQDKKNSTPTSKGDVKRGQMALADKEKAKGSGEEVSPAGAKASAKTKNI